MVVGDDVELTHLVFAVFVVFDALDGAVVHCHVFQLAVVAFGFTIGEGAVFVMLLTGQ